MLFQERYYFEFELDDKLLFSENDFDRNSKHYSNINRLCFRINENRMINDSYSFKVLSSKKISEIITKIIQVGLIISVKILCFVVCRLFLADIKKN